MEDIRQKWGWKINSSGVQVRENLLKNANMDHDDHHDYEDRDDYDHEDDDDDHDEDNGDNNDNLQVDDPPKYALRKADRPGIPKI